MDLAEFKKRFITDQKERKRLKLYKAGHTDHEIALSCGVSYWLIRYWRKSNKLPPNIGDYGKSYKSSFNKHSRGAKQI